MIVEAMMKRLDSQNSALPLSRTLKILKGLNRRDIRSPWKDVIKDEFLQELTIFVKTPKPFRGFRNFYSLSVFVTARLPFSPTRKMMRPRNFLLSHEFPEKRWRDRELILENEWCVRASG